MGKEIQRYLLLFCRLPSPLVHSCSQTFRQKIHLQKLVIHCGKWKRNTTMENLDNFFFFKFYQHWQVWLGSLHPFWEGYSRLWRIKTLKGRPKNFLGCIVSCLRVISRRPVSQAGRLPGIRVLLMLVSECYFSILENQSTRNVCQNAWGQKKKS